MTLYLVAVALSTMLTAAPQPPATSIFSSGEGKYVDFLNPGMVQLNNWRAAEHGRDSTSDVDGRLLVFCEGRRGSGGDGDPVDVVLKMSDDGGKSWSELMVVVTGSNSTMGNVVPVVMYVHTDVLCR
jgi:hypothetical protein